MTALLTILSVVIGLVFVLLLFSLLASTVMEIISSILSLRGKHLLVTLQNMLGGKAEDFLNHPFFKQLSYATNHRSQVSNYKLPGWISKGTFSAIMIDLLDTEDADVLAKKVDRLPEGDLRKLMQYLLRQSDGSVNGFRVKIEHWFEEVMERATEWFKRATKWWLFGIGFVMAGIFNADTIQIYKSLSANATLREDFVHMAEGLQQKNEANAAQPLAAEKTLDQLLPQFTELSQTYKETVQSPLGLGWTDTQLNDWKSGFWVRLMGWILTGIAVTFGAPFWFEVLKKLLALRNAKGAEITDAPSGDSKREKASPAQQQENEMESIRVPKKPRAR